MFLTCVTRTPCGYAVDQLEKYPEDSSTFEISYFVAKDAEFVAKMVAKVRGPDVAVVGHLILTPVKPSSQP
ncbi:hypothetical protein AVEN_150337-1 [Araneus ventricosus]|uniref:Uncharacterized protein n=1 Tax=Araneus ventricosus TaxID=182803 RepID=A0A4Y2X1E9_ARAVE|nr:hypothetical protein AVEN_150337-1 [Araneus ventricosus]